MAAFAWAFAIAVACVVLGMFAGWAWGYVVAWREDRAREAAYAEAWAKAHRAAQDRGRYLTDDPNRPE